MDESRDVRKLYSAEQVVLNWRIWGHFQDIEDTVFNRGLEEKRELLTERSQSGFYH